MRELIVVLLIYFSTISIFADSDLIDDLCYEKSTVQGFNFGIVKFMYKITTPIVSLTEETLSDVNVTLAYKDIVSAFDDCGIDDISGKCEKSSDISMMKISGFSKGIAYDMPDYSSKDTHTTYNEAMFSFMDTPYKWLATYNKNGSSYSGELKPCIPKEIPNSGIFDAYEKNLIDKNITTKIVSKSFDLNLTSLENNSVLSCDNNITILYDLYDYDTQSKVTNKWFEWDLKKHYPIKKVTFSNIQKAYKDVRVRFKYCQQIKDDTYTEKMKPNKICNKKDTIVNYPKCDDNSDKYEFNYASSIDNFAIRPDKFDIKVTNNLTKARLNYDTNLTFKSLSYTDKLVPNYNEDTNNSFTIDINITDSSKKCNISNIKANLMFNNGEQNTTLDSFDVGEWNITIKEINNSEFAKVDEDDTGDIQRFISPKSKLIILIPNSFDINTTFKNSNVLSNFTYISDDLTQSSDLNVVLKALKWDNTLTKNYTNSCYAKDFNLTIDYNPLNISSKHINYRVVQLDKNSSLDVNDSFVINASKVLFKDENNGSSSFQIDINFDRNKTDGINPFTFKLTSIGIVDSDGVSVDEVKEQNTTFIYGRTYISRQTFIDIKESCSYMYFEVYCYGNGCDKNLLKSKIGSNLKYINDIRWFINENHTQLKDGVVGSISQKYVDVIEANSTDKNPSKICFKYNNNYGRPYKATMQNEASSWLIYNPENNNAKVNSFDIEFINIGEWTGKHKTDVTTNKLDTSKINRRTIW